MKLTNLQTIYGLATLAVMFVILGAILVFFAEQTSNCWNLYSTEAQAIEACEK